MLLCKATANPHEFLVTVAKGHRVLALQGMLLTLYPFRYTLSQMPLVMGTVGCVCMPRTFLRFV